MTDQNTNIQQLKNQVSKFTEERNWGEYHNPKNLSMSIAIEASELMEIFQWLNEKESWEIMSSSEAIHLKEELADVMIYCLSLANQLDIDISNAIEEKIKKNSIKYPISFKLPNNLKGRSLHEMVIPTVCNLENMLNTLIKANGDFNKLKQWEKRSYKAYNIDEILYEIMYSEPNAWKNIIKEHILDTDVFELGASCIDIYLVAYVAENYGKGKENFFKYILDNGISDKPNTAQAIWQVGKGDGVYLGVLNDDGTVKDRDFFMKWLS